MTFERRTLQAEQTERELHEEGVPGTLESHQPQIRLYGKLRKQGTDRESHCRHQQGTGGFETELRGNPRSAEDGTETRRYEGGQHDGAGGNAA